MVPRLHKGRGALGSIYNFHSIHTALVPLTTTSQPHNSVYVLQLTEKITLPSTSMFERSYFNGFIFTNYRFGQAVTWRQVLFTATSGFSLMESDNSALLLSASEASFHCRLTVPLHTALLAYVWVIVGDQVSQCFCCTVATIPGPYTTTRVFIIKGHISPGTTTFTSLL